MKLYLAFLRMQAGATAPAMIGVVIAVVTAFVLPLALPQGSAVLASDAQRFMTRAPLIGLVLLITAYVTGVAAALNWAEEGQANRGVYAMVLPFPRWLVSLVEYAAGATLVVAASLLVWACAFGATLAYEPPPGLRAYPFDMGLRFFGTAILAHAVLFGPARAAMSLDQRGRLRGVLLVVLLLAALFLATVLGGGPWILRGFEWFFEAGGPFHFVTGGWSLYDI